MNRAGGRALLRFAVYVLALSAFKRRTRGEARTRVVASNW